MPCVGGCVPAACVGSMRAAGTLHTLPACWLICCCRCCCRCHHASLGHPPCLPAPPACSRALSPKRSQRPTHPTSGDDDSDAAGAAAAAAAAAAGTGGSPASSPSFISLTGRAGSRSRYRPRRRRSAATASAEMPELEKSEEEFRRDWGITRDREVRRLPACLPACLLRAAAGGAVGRGRQ